jgi:hypothetical protein
MDRVVPILAQASNITSISQFQQLAGHALGLSVSIGALVALYLIWRGLQMDRSSGEWKNEILKGVMWFAAPAIVNVLFNLFFGQTLQISFA